MLRFGANLKFLGTPGSTCSVYSEPEMNQVQTYKTPQIKEAARAYCDAGKMPVSGFLGSTLCLSVSLSLWSVSLLNPNGQPDRLATKETERQRSISRTCKTGCIYYIGQFISIHFTPAAMLTSPICQSRVNGSMFDLTLGPSSQWCR